MAGILARGVEQCNEPDKVVANGLAPLQVIAVFSRQEQGGSVITATYSRKDGSRFLIWNVDRLIKLAADLPVKNVPLAAISELDSEMWFGGPRHVRPTCREVAEHARRIAAVDTSFPIILSATGSLMDGMHRVARALMEGRSEIRAVQFIQDPEPDEERPA